jgi:hypothetical protein
MESKSISRNEVQTRMKSGPCIRFGRPQFADQHFVGSTDNHISKLISRLIRIVKYFSVQSAIRFSQLIRLPVNRMPRMDHHIQFDRSCGNSFTKLIGNSNIQSLLYFLTHHECYRVSATLKPLGSAFSHSQINQAPTFFHISILTNKEWSDVSKSLIFSHSPSCANDDYMKQFASNETIGSNLLNWWRKSKPTKLCASLRTMNLSEITVCWQNNFFQGYAFEKSKCIGHFNW